MVYEIVAVVTLYIVYQSILLLAKATSHQHSFSSGSFLLLCMIYLTILIGFGVWYLLLEINHIPALVGNGIKRGDSYISMLGNSLYFSGATLFSVGYGDITPIGIGKWLALIEALIGYTIPASFVVHTIQYRK